MRIAVRGENAMARNNSRLLTALGTACHRAALPLVAFVLAASASAGSFQVNPIRIELGKGATTAVVTVRNDGEEPVVLQSSVLGWTQDGGKDIYTSTSEALITPPVMTIAPGAEQIVRVGLRRPADPRNELAYRVFLQEVPPPPKPGFTGLQVALRVGIPMFVAPVAAPAVRKLDWSAAIGADGAIKLVAQNPGNAHVQITDFELRVPDASEPVAHESSLAYVLAGQRREWTLPAAQPVKSASELRLKALTDAGEVDTAVRLDR
jgi:fimbrial chaperone protein